MNTWNIPEKSCSAPNEAISSVGFPFGKGETSLVGAGGKTVTMVLVQRSSPSPLGSLREGVAEAGTPWRGMSQFQSQERHEGREPQGLHWEGTLWALEQDRKSRVRVPKCSWIQKRWRDSLLCQHKLPDP